MTPLLNHGYLAVIEAWGLDEIIAIMDTRTYRVVDGHGAKS